MIRLFLIALFSTTLISAPVKAQDFTDAQRAEIEKMFEAYLLENGETVLKSVNLHQAKLEEKQRAEAADKANRFLKELNAKKNVPMAGNANGDITLVEFFDYNCGYCRKALEEIQTLLEDDDQLKVIFMDMPILGPSSVEAAKWSLAANKQGKYFEYHQAIMEHNGEKNNDSLAKIAKKLDLDVKQMEKDKEGDDITAIIQNQVKAAQEIGIRGTPGFILNGQVYPGYMPAAQIKKIIVDARKANK